MAVLEYQKITNRVFSEFSCHCHTVYEIYYFISGDCDIMIEGKVHKLSPHSLVLIAPGVMHGIQVNSTDNYIRDVLFVTPQDITPERRHILTNIVPDIKKDPGKVFIYEHTEKYHLNQYFLQLKQLEAQPDTLCTTLEPIFIEALLAQINILCHTMKPLDSKYHSNNKISEVLTYINLHLTEPLNLEEIANHFFISKNYLNKLFKESLGTTVIEYIRYKRVVLAKQYILEKEESATNAALLVGFSDYSSFYRTYEKYLHSSPRKDQQKKRA